MLAHYVVCCTVPISRYKRKLKERETEMTRLRKECDDLKAAEIRALKAKKECELKDMEEGANSRGGGELMEIKKEEDIKKESDEGGSGLEESKLAVGALAEAEGGSPDSGGAAEAAAAAAARIAELKGKSDTAKIEQLQKQLTKDQETIKDLKSQLKKSNNEMKERSLLLEMYKTCTKEIRDKAQLMAAEKRARCVYCRIFSAELKGCGFGPFLINPDPTERKILNWSSVFWIRIQLNPDLAKNLVPDPEDPESESGS